MSDAKPNFFIVGAPRCGTTAFQSYLSQHPDIFMPDTKEIHYFGSDLEFRAPLTQKRRTWDTYLSFFQGWSGEARIGEASVFYLVSARAAQEIYDYNPDARIIIMLRNPVDAMYSRYYHLLYKGSEELSTFEEALAAEEQRKQGYDIPEMANWVGTLFYREIGRYANQVQRYIDLFGREQVHIIIFDDFKDDLQLVYKNTLDFLGLDSGFRPDFPVVNASRTTRNPRIRNFLKYPPEWYQSLLDVGKKVIPHSVRMQFNNALKSYKAVPFKRPPMKPETRQQLTAEFTDEIIKLGEILDRDLDHWFTIKDQSNAKKH